MIDFQQVKADNPIEKVAELLGLQLKKAGNTFRCPCPSGEGNDRGMVITPEKGVFYSFPKQKGGDCLALISFVKGCSPKEAAEWLVGDKQPEKKQSASSTKGGEKPSEGFSPLTYLDPQHEAVIALGFDPDDAAKLGIGFAPRGVLKGHVAVPVRNEDGSIAGYIGIDEAKLPPRWAF